MAATATCAPSLASAIDDAFEGGILHIETANKPPLSVHTVVRIEFYNNAVDAAAARTSQNPG
jgi:hypothetical protein